MTSVKSFADRYESLYNQNSKDIELRAMIFWLFDDRCVKCKRLATDVNEIIPRSRSEDAVKDWKNRVTLCKDCHNIYHEHGVTDILINDMRNERKLFLFSIGKGDYA